jgi:uncharacterized OB-fold protein
MSEEPLRLRQRVTLRYRFAAGRYASRFFAGLREGRVLASVDGGGRVLLPPRPVSGLDDAPTNIYHLVDETDPARLRIGLPLEPVWREPSERVGSLADIVCFRPVRGGGEAVRAARPVPEPAPPEPLVSEQKIDLPFTYTAGPAHRAFLRGLAEGRMRASIGDDGERYVPARPFAPDGRHLTRTEEVAPRGVLVAATVARHLPGAPAFGLVRVDGSETPMLHRLGEGAEALAPGTTVEAVFAPEPREASVLAISHFRPA